MNEFDFGTVPSGWDRIYKQTIRDTSRKDGKHKPAECIEEGTISELNRYFLRGNECK
jgi:hypothetical protein